MSLSVDPGPIRINRLFTVFVKRLLALAIMGCLFAFGQPLRADLTIDLEDAITAALFDGDGIGDAAGPFLIDGESVNFSTDALTGVVATNSFGLGLNSGVNDPDAESFNIGESWTINADKALFFTGLELGGLQIEETFTIQSNQWINLSGVVTGAGVTYTAATGTFSLTDGQAGDIFTDAELTGGVSLTLLAGSNLTLGNLESTFGLNDDVELENISFRFNPVPEPTSGLVMAGLGLALLFRRER